MRIMSDSTLCFIRQQGLMEWPTGALHHDLPASSLALAQVNDLTRVSIHWGEGGRPKGPRTTPHHSRPYGTITRKD